jgi:cholinesterase
MTKFAAVLGAVLLLELGLVVANPLNFDHASHLRKREWAVGQPVKTSSGTVLGHNAKNKTAVSEYLGIPFAKPPIGPLRWAAPVRFEGSGSINASSYVSVVTSNTLEMQI